MVEYENDEDMTNILIEPCLQKLIRDKYANIAVNVEYPLYKYNEKDKTAILIPLQLANSDLESYFEYFREIEAEMPLKEILTLFLSLLIKLNKIHNLNIYHRDIKP
jgi:serine/threonine protein kinase